MKLREKSAAERADLAQQRRENVGLVRAMETGVQHPEVEDWRKAQNFASLVNYAAAPIGSKKYDSNWLASQTAAR